MAMQVNASKIQLECAQFLKTSFMKWTNWLQKLLPHTTQRKSDLTGELGTGLGVLNTIDSELLMSRLAVTDMNHHW